MPSTRTVLANAPMARRPISPVMADVRASSMKASRIVYAVRLANAGDYAYCYRLTKKNMLDLFTRHWGGWVPSKFREGYAFARVFIIILNNRRIGYYSIRSDKKHLHIDNIQISSSHRGRGIGASIIRKILARHKYMSVGLTTFSDNPALRLYVRLGFKVTARNGGTLEMQRTA